MKPKVIQLLIAASILVIPFIARADALIGNDIAEGVVPFFDTEACVKVCLKEIAGTSIEIRRVDINFDKKAEYRVSVTECGSAGCAAAIFMNREGAWIKLTEGWGMYLLRSKTKGFADLGSGRTVKGEGKLVWDGRNYAWHK